MRPANPQISLRISAILSEPLLVAWIFYDPEATDWTSFGVSKLKMRLHRLVWVYTCQDVTFLEITCHGSNIFSTTNSRFGILILLLVNEARLQEKFSFFWKPKKYWNSEFWTPKNSPSLRMCENIRVPSPPPPPPGGQRNAIRMAFRWRADSGPAR